jgi:hypothetical protein
MLVEGTVITGESPKMLGRRGGLAYYNGPFSKNDWPKSSTGRAPGS